MLEPIRPPALADLVAERLERLILEGALGPGEKLAPERELSEKLGVSRPSLREALDRLERKGLVETGRGGTVVAQFLSPLASPLAALLSTDGRVAEDYFEYRRLLEPQAAQLAAQRATPPDREALADCLAQMQAAHTAADPAAEAAADTRLHLLITESSHNLVLLHVQRVFSDLLRGGILSSREQFFHRDTVRDALLAQHRAIGEAILAGRAEAAEAAMREHIAFTAAVFHELRQQESRLSESLRKLGRGEMLAG
ncbi:FadR family transcriptional regulator [Roseomonas sp. OT10]|uniref:FadR/GntR family transcriptional regulator n=1 Tax=Roseomonas cutis TaxID=2897332 RepID=UPI001E355D8C|nr:FadR/GntR family transcriptional regulator [Roseomonas sp. OT10]UFN46821.1 FadR family transcriptional regulator [Roseomonas sp. OT10]